jgi:hypothetical protein
MRKWEGRLAVLLLLQQLLGVDEIRGGAQNEYDWV